MAMELVLILEDDTSINYYSFDSSKALEDYLKNINLDNFLRKNILFYIDDEINDKLTELYKKKYL